VRELRHKRTLKYDKNKTKNKCILHKRGRPNPPYHSRVAIKWNCWPSFSFKLLLACLLLAGFVRLCIQPSLFFFSLLFFFSSLFSCFVFVFFRRFSFFFPHCCCGIALYQAPASPTLALISMLTFAMQRKSDGRWLWNQTTKITVVSADITGTAVAGCAFVYSWQRHQRATNNDTKCFAS